MLSVSVTYRDLASSLATTAATELGLHPQGATKMVLVLPSVPMQQLIDKIEAGDSDEVHVLLSAAFNKLATKIAFRSDLFATLKWGWKQSWVTEELLPAAHKCGDTSTKVSPVQPSHSLSYLLIFCLQTAGGFTNYWLTASTYANPTAVDSYIKILPERLVDSGQPLDPALLPTSVNAQTAEKLTCGLFVLFAKLVDRSLPDPISPWSTLCNCLSRLASVRANQAVLWCGMMMITGSAASSSDQAPARLS